VTHGFRGPESLGPLGSEVREMSRYLITIIVLLFSFSGTALASEFEKTPRTQATYKYDRTIKPVDRRRQRGEELNHSFQRQYWEPCNSTFHEYIVNNCNGG
jgi:hypothetical protein